MTLLDAALAFHQAGCSVVPTRPDGTKAPAAFWKQYMTAAPDARQVATWLSNGAYDGFGIVCGQVSGHLEMFELEGRAVTKGDLLARLTAALNDNDLNDLWRRLNDGYLELTPSGGLHWLYRVHGTARPNLKLARDPDGLILIETRGEGGYVVTAPSAGRTHPTGKAWTALVGHPGSIPVITEDERDSLHAVAALFDQTPPDKPPDDTPAGTPRNDQGGARPGDHYNQKATWDDILTPHGWTRVRRIGGGWAWRRPGKDRGISATTGTSGDGADRLYVFSTSTGFDTEKPYSKFAAHTLLDHGGDWTLAAKTLRAAGYGTPHRAPAYTDPTELVAPASPIQITTTPDTTTTDTQEEPHTDLGNARRLVAAHGHRLRYMPVWKRWLIWDGRRWADDDTGEVWRCAKQVARGMLRRSVDAPDTDRRDKLIAAAKRAESARGLHAMVDLAGTEPGIALAPGQLDTDPWLLNVTNGTLDLRTGTLEPHDPAQHLTKITGAAYHPDASAPEFTRFLERVQPDPAMRAFLARLFGYALLGRVEEHVLPIPHGTGANGKSTLMTAITGTFGEYAASADPSLLIERRSDAHPTGIADLFGRRLVVTHETDAGRRLAEGTVKRITGGDVIKARRMNENFWEFKPAHLVVMITNHRPIITGDDEGIWRRIRLIPFDVKIPDHEQDKQLEDKLIAERDGILAWLVAGYHDWRRRGLGEPKTVTDATDAYRCDSDALGRFLDQRCLTGTHYTARSSELFAAWSNWARGEGVEPGTQTAFSLALVNRGFDPPKKSHGRKIWHGLGLQSEDDEE